MAQVNSTGDIPTWEWIEVNRTGVITTWDLIEVNSTKECGVKELQSMRCSSCGRYYTSPYLYYVQLPNFCPWCGAVTAEKEVR